MAKINFSRMSFFFYFLFGGGGGLTYQTLSESEQSGVSVG